MHHPFQAIAVVPKSGPDTPVFFLAASGPLLVIVNLQDGTIGSRWEAPFAETPDSNVCCEIFILYII
jgi:hypothetical protein